jgi:hypothetical protein
MSNITLQKLDGRHALNSFFGHRAKMVGMDNAPNFVEIRNWLWENHGPGIERELVWMLKYHATKGTISPFKAEWAWHVDDRKFYIYMKDEVLTHFTLRWMNT